MGVAVRRFQDEDFHSIVALEEGEKRNRYGAAVFVRQSAALYPQTFLVANSEGKPVGYTVGAGMQDDPATAWVLRLHVKQPHQGQGTGKALLLRLITELATRDVRHILLSVAPGNIRAKKLYENLGFFKVAHQSGYFCEGEDRDIMRYVISR